MAVVKSPEDGRRGSEPSVAQTEAMLVAVKEMASAGDHLWPTRRTNLVRPEKSLMGRCRRWVATATYNLGKAVQFRKDLAKGLNNSAEMPPGTSQSG